LSKAHATTLSASGSRVARKVCRNGAFLMVVGFAT
jgi:hypothetical protein